MPHDIEHVGFQLKAAYTPDLEVPLVGINIYDMAGEDEGLPALAVNVSADDAEQLSISLLRCVAGANFSMAAETYAKGLVEEGDYHGAEVIRDFMVWFGGYEVGSAERSGNGRVH